MFIDRKRAFIWSLLSVWLGGLLFTSAAFAQNVPDRMHVVVEDDDDFSNCGLSVSGLEGTAKAALRYNRIEIVAPANELYLLPVVYVAVNSIEITKGYCVSNIQISAKQFDMFPREEGDFYSGFFHYCDTASILTGPDHQSRVNSAVREQIDECLGQIALIGFPSALREVAAAAGKRARAAKE